MKVGMNVKNNVDLIDVMVAVNQGKLKCLVRNGHFLLEDTVSGERVRLNAIDSLDKDAISRSV